MTFNPTPFETERIILKPTTGEDAPFLLELLNSPKWIENIGDRNVKTVQEAEKYIEDRIVSQFNRIGYGNYTVIRKEDGKRMGSCGMYDRPGLEGVDIGFAFLPEFEKQGYGYESAKAVLDHVQSNFTLKEVCAITIPSNVSSQKLLEKLGLIHIKMITLPGSSEELMYYKITL